MDLSEAYKENLRIYGAREKKEIDTRGSGSTFVEDAGKYLSMLGQAETQEAGQESRPAGEPSSEFIDFFR